jgi:hypothetical protein
MNNMIITFEDGSKKEYRKGTKFGDIVADVAAGREIICGNYNNGIVNYDDPIVKSGKLILYDINTAYGNRMYEKGLTFLFKVCASEILGEDTVIRIRHSIDRGIFFEVSKKLDSDIINSIKNYLLTITSNN